MNMEFTSVPRPPGPPRHTPLPPRPAAVEPPPRPHHEVPRPMAPPPKSGRRLKWLLAVLCLLFLAAAALFAWLWWQQRAKNQPTTTSPPAAAPNQVSSVITCDADHKTYQNQDLNIGFCYPEAWGQPSVVDAKLGPSDKGSRQMISFAAKPEVKLGLVSPDWSTTVGRGGLCSDPNPQPANFSDFSTDWKTQGPADAPNLVSRGVELKENSYIITEEANDLFGGVCLKGITLINTDTYKQATASYFKEFSGAVASPKAHMDNPTVLVPASERAAFTDFVKSVKKL